MADVIKRTYKKLPCYKLMDDDYKIYFDSLAGHYGSMLNKGPAKRSTIYTLHDFDHHCFDIYRIISMFILGEAGLKELTSEELYLLNLSVLFHDISMAKGGWEDGHTTAFDRDIHSRQSAQWIKHEYKETGSCLNTNGNLSFHQIEMICKICEAHSDIKVPGANPGGVPFSGLDFAETGETEDVRVKALAGILRLADELDVFYKRRGTAEEVRAMDPNDEEDMESKKHWERLRYITDLAHDPNSTLTLLLMLNDEAVLDRINSGDEVSVVEELNNILDKIDETLNVLWREVLEKDINSSRLMTIKYVRWKSSDKKILDLLNQTERITLPNSPKAPSKNKTGPVPPKRKEKSRNITLLDQMLSIEIHQYVQQNNLLSIGHYQINADICGRDWIDTAKLLNGSETSSKIVQIISNHILNCYASVGDGGKESPWIVGLDVVGTTLAARVGFLLNMPFTYVIPIHQQPHTDPHEIQVPKIPDGRKLLLVTDCVITGKTIYNIITDNGWEDKVLAVYTVLYREPKLPLKSDEQPALKYKIYSLCDDFPAEIAYVKDCPYGTKPGSCRAINKIGDWREKA